MTIIPKARRSRKYPFDELKINEYFISGEFTRDHQKYMGAIVAYYNRTRGSKNFVQRDVKGQNRIYRKK